MQGRAKAQSARASVPSRTTTQVRAPPPPRSARAAPPPRADDESEEEYEEYEDELRGEEADAENFTAARGNRARTRAAAKAPPAASKTKEVPPGFPTSYDATDDIHDIDRRLNALQQFLEAAKAPR